VLLAGLEGTRQLLLLPAVLVQSSLSVPRRQLVTCVHLSDFMLSCCAFVLCCVRKAMVTVTKRIQYEPDATLVLSEVTVRGH